MTGFNNHEFDNKCYILSELWQTYRDNLQWKDFFEYNDIALPLSFLIVENLVEVKETGVRFIEETYELLCETLKLDSTDSYEDLDEMMQESKEVTWEEEDNEE